MLILLAVICSLSSCVKEELIGPSEKEGLPVTIGVSMSALEATTKADTKSSATDDEARINDGFILVFKKADVNADPNECIGYAKVEPTDDIKGEGVTVNTITGHVRFVGIANADENLSQKLITAFAGTTKGNYAALKAMTSSQVLDDPTKLIKVGTKDEELKLPPTNEKINIEVVQLVARVDFTVPSITTNAGVWRFNISSYTVTSVCKESDLIIENGGKNGREDVIYDIKNKEVANNKVLFYTYQTSKVIKLSVTGQLVNESTNETKSQTYSVDLKPQANLGHLTDGFVHGWAYNIEGKINVQNSTLTVVITVRKWDNCEVDVDYGDYDKY